VTRVNLRVLPLAFAVAAPALGAQSIYDVGARIAPQFHSYSVDAPSNLKVSEFAVPLFVLVPISPSFTIDVGTSYARSHVEQTALGKTTTSSISGLTDTQVRGHYVIGNDFIVLTAGVNLPTGQSTIPESKLVAASLIGSDFLSFPISNMGTGFGGTGGIALARPLGEWNLGVGVSMRRSAQYDPFDVGGGPALHYQPGNEYRARVGLDRAVGTGRATIGVTYSAFGNDELAGSVYNTGDRYLTQFTLNDTYGGGELTLTAWDLFRTAGTLSDGTALDHENIANASLSFGVRVGSATIEPNIEGRTWTQPGSSTSLMGTFGIRSQITVGGMAVLPGVGISVGRVAAQDNAVNTTATLTGFHATLAVRLR
jgi:hypothetical protein